MCKLQNQMYIRLILKTSPVQYQVEGTCMCLDSYGLLPAKQPQHGSDAVPARSLPACSVPSEPMPMALPCSATSPTSPRQWISPGRSIEPFKTFSTEDVFGGWCFGHARTAFDHGLTPDHHPRAEPCKIPPGSAKGRPHTIVGQVDCHTS